MLFSREEGCLASARVAPEADRCGVVEAGRFEGDGGPNAVEHEAGRKWQRAEGVLRSSEVGGDNRPPSAQCQGD